MKNKKPIIALGALAVLGLIGGTIAYFTSEATFDNVFTTATYKTKSTETFSSPDNWLPGQTIDKTVSTLNEGTIPVAVRVSTSEKWTLADNTEITMPHTFDMGTTSDTSDDVTYNSDRDLVTLNYGEHKDTMWLSSSDTSDKHLYYYKKLAPNATTDESFLASVTLNANVPTDTNCVTEGTVGQGTVTKTCTTGIKGLGKATYTLTITVETVQADQYQNAWTTAPAITETDND